MNDLYSPPAHPAGRLLFRLMETIINWIHGPWQSTAEKFAADMNSRPEVKAVIDGLYAAAPARLRAARPHDPAYWGTHLALRGGPNDLVLTLHAAGAVILDRPGPGMPIPPSDVRDLRTNLSGTYAPFAWSQPPQ